MHMPRSLSAETDQETGLAVSGGVDSMALAWLCSEMRKDSRGYEFTAFVVDHKLRKGSTEEAHQVRHVLDGLGTLHRSASKRTRSDFITAGLRSRILTLDWQGDHPVDDMEAAARRLRYRALGQACHEDRLGSLWFAHHADDQAETVLMRIANIYLGAGLAGMHTVSQIPECEGMYGVRQSGKPRRLSLDNSLGSRLWTENGGVSIIRPLLSYTKEELIATCKKARVRWFEDETNTDPSITLRNTVRSLHSANCLPVALQRPRLHVVAERVRQRNDLHEAEAIKIFRKLKPLLDMRVGTLQCTLPEDTFNTQSTDVDIQYVQAKAISKLVELVSPVDAILLNDIANITHILGAEHSATSKPLKVSVASTLISREANYEGGLVLTMQRAPPYRTQAENCRMEVDIPNKGYHGPNTTVWSTWHLWDNRFWVRLGRGRAIEKSPQVCVRFLSTPDIVSTRVSLATKARKDFNKTLERAKGDARFTLPAIFCVDLSDDGQSFVEDAACERLVALPTLSWSRDGWQRFGPKTVESKWLYETRYKHVDESLTEPISKV